MKTVLPETGFWLVFGRLVRTRIVLDIRQWVALAGLAVFLAIALVFFQFVRAMQGAFIDRLKAIYPESYLVLRGSLPDPPHPDLIFEAEVFSHGDSFRFRFDGDQPTYTLTGIGVRALSQERLAHLVDKDETVGEGPILYGNQAFFQKLTHVDWRPGQPIYGVEPNGETRRLETALISTFGQDAWLILSSNEAKHLGYRSNIAAIYVPDALGEGKVRDLFEGHDQRPVFWHERLPFLEIVLVNATQRAALLIVIALLVLVIGTGGGFFRDLLTVFGGFFRLATVYGISQPVTALAANSFLLLYLLAVLVLAIPVSLGLGGLLPGEAEMTDPMLAWADLLPYLVLAYPVTSIFLVLIMLKPGEYLIPRHWFGRDQNKGQVPC